MKRNLTHKILETHLVEGKVVPGGEIAIRIDHTLLQDATGTLPMLVKHTGQSMEKIRQDTERDYFMDAGEALKYGIVDRIITERDMGKGPKA